MPLDTRSDETLSSPQHQGYGFALSAVDLVYGIAAVLEQPTDNEAEFRKHFWAAYEALQRCLCCSSPVSCVPVVCSICCGVLYAPGPTRAIIPFLERRGFFSGQECWLKKTVLLFYVARKVRALLYFCAMERLRELPKQPVTLHAPSVPSNGLWLPNRRRLLPNRTRHDPNLTQCMITHFRFVVFF